MPEIHPIEKQKVLKEIAAYGNCSDFLHDMMREYHEKILGISLNNIYDVYDDKKKFEEDYYNKNKKWPSFDETYEFIKKIVDDKKYYQL